MSIYICQRYIRLQEAGWSSHENQCWWLPIVVPIAAAVAAVAAVAAGVGHMASMSSCVHGSNMGRRSSQLGDSGDATAGSVHGVGAIQHVRQQGETGDALTYSTLSAPGCSSGDLVVVDVHVFCDC
jgi:hypothetical protein